jgi:hypothetical protein
MHGSTPPPAKFPGERLEHDEPLLLRPLAERPSRSLSLLPAPEPTAPKSLKPPQFAVERRPLPVYAALAGEGV